MGSLTESITGRHGRHFAAASSHPATCGQGKIASFDMSTVSPVQQLLRRAKNRFGSAHPVILR